MGGYKIKNEVNKYKFRYKVIPKKKTKSPPTFTPLDATKSISSGWMKIHDWDQKNLELPHSGIF